MFPYFKNAGTATHTPSSFASAFGVVSARLNHTGAEQTEKTGYENEKQGRILGDGQQGGRNGIRVLAGREVSSLMTRGNRKHLILIRRCLLFCNTFVMEKLLLMQPFFSGVSW